MKLSQILGSVSDTYTTRSTPAVRTRERRQEPYLSVLQYNPGAWLFERTKHGNVVGRSSLPCNQLLAPLLYLGTNRHPRIQFRRTVLWARRIILDRRINADECQLLCYPPRHT